MNKEYLITFSSFYQARYAQEKIMKLGIRCTIKRAPSELAKSCGYAVYLKTDSIGKVFSLFDGETLSAKGAFVIDNSSGAIQYRRIEIF